MSNDINQLDRILTDEIKSWYQSKIREFHLAIDEEGKVLYFSDQALDFFSYLTPSEGENQQEYRLGDLINSNDSEIILTTLHNSRNSDGELELQSPLNGANFKLLWKIIDRASNTFFLLFNRQDCELGYRYQVDSTLIEELPFAAAIVEHDNFVSLNNKVTALLYDLDLNEFSDLKSYLNKKTETSAPFFTRESSTLEARIPLGEEMLFIHGGYLSKDSDKFFISLVKERLEKQIIEKEIIIEQKVTGSAESGEQSQELEFNSRTMVDIQSLRSISYEIESTIDTIIESLDGDTSELITKAKEGYRDVGEALKGTSQNLLKMSEIAQFIEDVSIKIHMISINAAIESARAGETGKGFSVIAREIRKLSEETKSYTKMIGTEIEKIITFTEQMFSGERLEGSTGEVGALLDQYQAKVKGLISNLKQSTVKQLSSLG